MLTRVKATYGVFKLGAILVSYTSTGSLCSCLEYLVLVLRDYALSFCLLLSSIIHIGLLKMAVYKTLLCWQDFTSTELFHIRYP